MMIRPLTADDAKALKRVRLKALRNDGPCFTANLEEERQMTRVDWNAAAAETTGQVTMGAFCGSRLVGIMGAKKFEKDPSGKTVYWRALYIEPSYRKSNVGLQIFAAIDRWSVDRGFESAVFTVHPKNACSLHVSRKHGAQKFGEEPMRFADGSVARAVWFRKILAGRLLAAGAD